MKGEKMDYQDRIGRLQQALIIFFAEREGVFSGAADEMCGRVQNGGKILVFGNGGSAAQAQHFAAELVNKFLIDRQPLPCIALTTDTSALTSIANDLSFDDVFSRQVEALGMEGDAVLGITTSGNSANVVKAVRSARECGMMTAVLTGEGGGKVGSTADYCLDVASSHTPLIQEAHLFLLHLLAEEIERRLGKDVLP